MDIEDNSRSVYRRINLICTHYNLQSIDFALVDLLICWRNRLTHFQAENNIAEQSRLILQDSSEKIEESHCGLNIQQTLKSFDCNEFPSFKEVTSFVRASVNFASEVDKYLLRDISWVTYADRIIINYLKAVKEYTDESNRHEMRERRLNNIFSKDTQSIEKSIRQILFQHGFTSQNPNDVDEFCKNISLLSFQDAKTKLAHGSFI